MSLYNCVLCWDERMWRMWLLSMCLQTTEGKWKKYPPCHFQQLTLNLCQNPNLLPYHNLKSVVGCHMIMTSPQTGNYLTSGEITGQCKLIQAKTTILYHLRQLSYYLRKSSRTSDICILVFYGAVASQASKLEPTRRKLYEAKIDNMRSRPIEMLPRITWMMKLATSSRGPRILSMKTIGTIVAMQTKVPTPKNVIFQNIK